MMKPVLITKEEYGQFCYNKIKPVPVLDEIHLQADEWHRLQEAFNDGGVPYILDYLTHPALPSFRLVLESTGEWPLMNISVIPPDLCGVKGWYLKDGGYAKAAMCVRISSPGIPSEVIVALGGDYDEILGRYIFFSDFVVHKPDCVPGNMACGLAWQAFYIVQDILTNRPEILRYKTMIRRQENHGKGKSHNHRHKTKAVKIITIDPDGLESCLRSINGRKCTCPCWGVIGHWRQYKSGKRVWVNAYLKGSERANAGKYVKKEYELYIDGGDCNA